MKSLYALLSVIALLAGSNANADQLYKWVSAEGKVTYSDTPPPKDARVAQSKVIGTSSTVSTDSLPVALAQATKSNPVTLYTTVSCSACDAGRIYLNKRGVPFTEKTVTSDADIVQFKQVGGGNTLPLVVVGRSKHTGFDSAVWAGVLTSAGYPETNKLPAEYRNPQASAAAVPKVPKADDAPAETAADILERPKSSFRF